MSTKVSNKSKSTAILGMFIAITVVLQILSYVIPPIGGFSLSLVLIPIVLSAVLYGPAYASTVGFAFGVVAAIASVFGMDYRRSQEMSRRKTRNVSDPRTVRDV